MKVTPWFDGSVKPVRVGVYQRCAPLGFGVTFSMWTGKRWNFSAPSVEEAAIEEARSFVKDAHWRGLAQQPKGKK
jgi:hypothetical protein